MNSVPDIFLSDVSTDDWEPDPEVGGEMHVLYQGLGLQAGSRDFSAKGHTSPSNGPCRAVRPP